MMKKIESILLTEKELAHLYTIYNMCGHTYTSSPVNQLFSHIKALNNKIKKLEEDLQTEWDEQAGASL